MSERSELTLADGVRLHVETSRTGRRPGHRGAAARLVPGPADLAPPGRRAARADRRARVIAYDARGHGRSSATRLRSATLGQLGDDLAEVLARSTRRSGPVVLAGHSLGGMTIMEYADRYPAEFAERVAGLLFVSTTAEGHTHTRYGLPAQLAPAAAGRRDRPAPACWPGSAPGGRTGRCCRRCARSCAGCSSATSTRRRRPGPSPCRRSAGPRCGRSAASGPRSAPSSGWTPWPRWVTCRPRCWSATGTGSPRRRAPSRSPRRCPAPS